MKAAAAHPYHVLSFKNSFQLFLEANLSDYFQALESGHGNGHHRFIADRLRKWRLHRVEEVFLMVPGGLEPSRKGPSATVEGDYFLELEDIFQRNGLRVYLTPLAALANRDFAFQVKFNRTLTAGLKKHPSAVLFLEESRDEVEISLATLLLTPNNGLEPEKAIRYVARRAELKQADARVFEFKKYLDPGYELPAPEGPGQAADSPRQEAGSRTPEVETGAPEELKKSTEASTTESTTEAPAKSETKSGAVPEKKAPVETETVTPEVVAPAGAAAGTAEAPAAEAKAPAPAPEPATTPAPEQPKTESSGEGPSVEADPNFKASKFSIKVKMVGIISGIILLALGSMAFLATFFFREDSTARIQENNLALTEVIGGRVESEFENISYKGLLLATNLVEGNAAQQKTFTDLFFRKNANILFVGVARSNGGTLEFVRQQYNETFLADKQIEIDDVNRLHALGAEGFRQSFSGGTVVRNVSPGFPLPTVGLSLPFNDGNIVVLYLYLNEDPETGRFLKSFSKKTTGIATAYLVDSEGKIIAHPELEKVKAGADYVTLPIVTAAMESKNPNGLTPYTHEGVKYLGSFRKLNFANLAVISDVNEATALAAVEAIQRRNMIITLIVVLGSVLIVFFFARTISVPILKLVDATRQVEGGDYAISIQPSARDEVGRLTNSFVQMASGLAERERVKDALGKFVNKEIAELASAGAIHLGGERKEAAVFFSDLRGFTAMSEGRTPEEIVSILNEYFTAMVATIEETHGVVDKFIGDAIMAHWGAVKTVGNNTENAINAGLLMRKALVDLNARNANLEGSPFLKMGSGINTGPVISGQIGSDNRFEFTVIGDAVNLASRIEALNKPFGTDLLISQDSYDLVSDIFNVEPMPAIKVKGKAEPQTIYAILGRKDDPDCPANMDEVRALLGIEFDASKAGGGDEKEVKYEILEKK